MATSLMLGIYDRQPKDFPLRCSSSTGFGGEGQFFQAIGCSSHIWEERLEVHAYQVPQIDGGGGILNFLGRYVHVWVS